MTACSSKLQHLSYVAEGSWAENSTSTTSAQTIPITAMVDVSQLGRAMLDSGRVVQYRNDRPKMIPGPYAGTEFTIEVELVGHGSTTAGSVTATAFESLIAWTIGTSATGASGGTIGNTSTASSLVITAGPTYANGSLLRVGAKNDTRADGQIGRAHV